MFLGLCLCAGQLVATAASATVKTAVKTSYNKRSVGWDSTVKVTTKLINPKTGKAVTGKVKRPRPCR